MSTTTTLRDAALALAGAGWKIFPITPGQKEPPLIKGWQDKATSDPAIVGQWWAQWPDANIGTKAPFGLDIDTKNGKDGFATLATLEAKHGPLPETLTARTPSGGLHKHFDGPVVGNSASKIGPGLDIRSGNGYLVMPPSRTAAGVYEWVSRAPIAKATPWLIDAAGGSKVYEERPVETEITLEQRADLESALAHPALLASVGTNEAWSAVGYALLSLGDVGFELWEKFSEAAANPNPGAETAATWWGKHKNSKTRSDYRSIFVRARVLGWKNPNPGGSIDPKTIGFGKGPLPAGASLTPIVKPAAAAAPTTHTQQGAAAAGAPPPPTSRFPLINAWKYAEDGPDPEWLVWEWLPELGVGMLYGKSSVGKTFYVIDLVMAIVLGLPHGPEARKVRKPGRVVYVVAEGQGGFRKRIRAYRKHFEKTLPPDCPAPELIVVPPNLMEQGDAQAVLDSIATGGKTADLIIIDTLAASVAGADENSNDDMGTFMRNCRAIADAMKGFVLFIHHTGKDEGRGHRGAYALFANSETVIEVKKHTEGSVATITKQKDGEEGIQLAFRLERVELPPRGAGASPTSSCVLEYIPLSEAGAVDVPASPTKSKEPPAPKGAYETAFRDAVVAQAANFPGGAVPLEEALKAAVPLLPKPEPPKEDSRRKNLKRSAETLLKRGVLNGVMVKGVLLFSTAAVSMAASIAAQGAVGEPKAEEGEFDVIAYSKANPSPHAKLLAGGPKDEGSGK
jgi:hypothetical protein